MFSLDKGDKEIENIKPWLHTIKARAPHSPVIIVGTHLDKAEESGGTITLTQARTQLINHRLAEGHQIILFLPLSKLSPPHS